MKMEAKEEKRYGGAIPSRVKESVLDKTLDALGIEPLGTLIEKIQAFNAWTLKNCSKTNVADCSNCGGSSDVGKFKDACPLCGDIEEDAPAAAAKPPVKTKPALALVGQDIEIDASKFDQATIEITEADGGTVKKKGSKTKNMKSVNAVTGEGISHADAKAMQPKKPVAIVSAVDLDKAIDDIKKFEHEAGAKAWQCWQKLREIHESQLWRTRTRENGKSAYKTFEQFTKAELGMSKRYAFSMMSVAAKFTQKEIEEIGPTKLRLILQAPKEIQAELVEKSKKGASKAEIEKEIPRKKSKKTKQKLASAITVATIVGQKRVRLFAKPTSKGADPKPAKKIGDHPVGTLDLTNDVRMSFSIIPTATGELVLNVVTKRIEE